MRRIPAMIVLLAALAGAERVPAEFRLRKDAAAPMRGWIVEFDAEGFVFEKFGQGARRRIGWDDLVEEDARRLRIAFDLELSEEEEKGLVDGHEIEFKGGGSVRGVLVQVDEDGTHRVRVDGLVLPYPRERIARVFPVKIREEEAYSPEEIYVRRLERRPPRDAVEHRRLGDYLYDVGNWEGAREQYLSAIAGDGALRGELAPRLEEIEDYLVDRAAAEVFAKHKADAVLHGRWKEAIAAIRAYAEENPASMRRGERLIGDLETLWIEKKQARFHRVKNDEFDRTIRRFLSAKKPELAEARSWATTQLPAELRRRLKERLELSEDEMELFSQSKAKGAPHWASYWSGSFVVNDRVPKGTSTGRTVRGDPDAWWDTYQDVSVRANWLKAYAAERLDLFEVVTITMRECERCGGSGKVTKWSPTGTADGKHEWNERCPRCFGGGQDRGVGYR